LPEPHEAPAASVWSNPVGGTKLMEAVGAPAPAGESPETREAVETAGRVP